MHLKLTIEYDGTGFAGSQLQHASRGRTVQGELEVALARLAGGPVRVALAGRTDSGVHAAGQVASLDFAGRPRLDTPDAVRKALNALLPADLAVTGAEEAPEGFHARFSARRRAYRYLLWNGPSPSPLIRRYSLHVARKLDVEAMAQAARLLEGTHDLAAFAGQGLGAPARQEAQDDASEARPVTVRTVYLAKVAALETDADIWRQGAPLRAGDAPALDAGGRTSDTAGRLIAVDLVANAFLPQMIRTIAGTLLEVGSGKRAAGDLERVILSRDRSQAGATAKPQGLCLLWVEY